MSGGIVSHNTEGMRNWSSNLDKNNATYTELINELYRNIDYFVGSPEFKGGLSEDFGNNVLSKRVEFERFSETFDECVELIKERANKIDSDESELSASIRSSNPLG